MQNLVNKKNAATFWKVGVFLFFIVVDQFFKISADSIFKNQNFAFSLPIPTALIYLIYFVLIACISFYVYENHKKFFWWQDLAWVLIYAGAVANIGERIILGYVRDWIYISVYRWTGIYNLADGFIILGVVILLFSSNKKLA